MAVPSFLIKNGSTDFLSKQKSLFDLLESAEKETKVTTSHQHEPMEVDNYKSNKRKRKETKPFRGKESLFKEPVDLPIRFKRSYKIPDFQRNPHKWVKYSLADITQNDMSNESNTAAALSFLRDLKIQKKIKSIKKEPEEMSTSRVDQPHAHLFNVKIKQENDDIIESSSNDNKPVFKSSKLIMPEYVVGQVKKESKAVVRKKIPEGKGKEVYLNHIHEYEDD